MSGLGGFVISVGVGIATMLVIVAVAILPFLTPAWVGFEQDRSKATVFTGFSVADLRTATDAILADLVVGPPDFDVEVGGVPVLEERERAHMRDVRNVFVGLYAAAAVSVVLLALAGWRMRDRGRLWHAVERGAEILAVAVVVLGVVGLVAFDQLFETFHEVFFPAGSYTFDPIKDRLVQLFPFDFWQDSAIAVGVVIIVLAAIVALLARRRTPRAVGGATAKVAATAAIGR